jgi:tetratricopeptide (TPR) repeat protein
MPLFKLLTAESEECKILRNRLFTIREKVASILGINLSTDFTDHSVKHSDTVSGNVDELTSIIPEGKRPKPREAFILYAACYLHDIGMHFETAGTVQNEVSEQYWHDLPRDKRAEYLRSKHPQISAELVFKSVRSSQPPIGIQLTDSDYPGKIAALCEAHGVWLPAEEERYQELMDEADPSVRMGLLSGLLRMADILAETRDRAPRHQANAIELPLESQVHWWRHYYTKDVIFDSTLRCVKLIYDFPADQRERYKRIVPQLQFPAIQNELRRHDRYFGINDLNWRIETVVSEDPYSTAETMPNDVLVEVSVILQRREEYEAKARQISSLKEYGTVQPIIDKILEEINQLPEDADPLLKGKQLESAYQMLRKVGAKRQSRVVLEQAYHIYQNAGEHGKQLEIGLMMVPLMYAQRREFVGFHHVKECEAILDVANASDEQRLQTAILKAHGCDLEYYEPLEDFSKAIELAHRLHQTNIVEELTADLYEFFYLDTIENTSLPLTAPSIATAIADSSSHPSSVMRYHTIVARLNAERGNVEEAVHLLDQLGYNLLIDVQHINSWLLYVCTKAHILFLAGHYDEAIQTLESALSKISLHDYSNAYIVLQSNLLMCSTTSASVAMLRLNEVLYDNADFSGGLENEEEILFQGLSHQRKGNHPEAIVKFWRELRLAYASGEWRRYWQAEEYFALQCLRIGNLKEATRHVILSLSSSLAEDIGKATLASGNEENIRKVVNECLSSHLAQHFMIASKILAILWDVIPEDQIPSVFEFVLPYAQTTFYGLSNIDTVRPSWSVLKAVAPRLSQALAHKLIAHISALPLDQTHGFILEEIFDTLNFISPHLDASHLAQAANLTLPFTEGFPKNANHGIYYSSALNAIGHISHFAQHELKANIFHRLFPLGAPMDQLKIVALPHFGGSNVNDESYAQVAQHVIKVASEVISRQVIEAESPASNQPVPGASMSMSTSLEHGGVRIASLMGQREIKTVVAYMRFFSREELSVFVELCRQKLSDPNNLLANRVVILEALPELVTSLSAAHRKNVINTTFAIAQGGGISEADRQKALEARHPLNRFRMDMGSPEQLQGEALSCLARLFSTLSSKQQEKFWGLLQEWIISSDESIRFQGVRASKHLESVDDMILTALICALRDPSLRIVHAAYASLNEKKDCWNNDFLINLLHSTMKLAASVPDVSTRQWAAHLTSCLIPRLPLSSPHKKRIIELQKLFKHDICSSVRSLANSKKSSSD